MATSKVSEKKENRVAIELFKDSQKYKEDVVVIDNGRVYQIQRGVRVEVPESVAEILEQSRVQNAKALQHMENLQNEYVENERRLG